MAKEKHTGDLSPKTYVLIGAALCIIAALGFIASFLFWNAGRAPEPTLQPPEHSVLNSTEGLVNLVATAVQKQDRRSNRYRVPIRKQDNTSFRMHFENAAARRGWYAYGSNEYHIKVVLPEEELRHLEKLQDDPSGWIRRENAKTGPATGPSSLDLTNALVSFPGTSPNHKQRLALVGGIFFGTVLGGLGTKVLVVGIESCLDRRAGQEGTA